jgi:hypothetical protein
MLLPPIGRKAAVFGVVTRLTVIADALVGWLFPGLIWQDISDVLSAGELVQV